MKKIFLILFAALLSLQSMAQITFIIDDFSDKYYGKLYVADTADIYNEDGWIAIYDKSNDKELISTTTFNLYFTLHDGELRSNIIERPYGEQSVLIYDDFNFDGEDDFALCNGNNSCYGGPAFDIYLYDNGSFTYSESFSKLSNNYCGMFQYDASEKRIYTMTKSGCCWHEYSEFVVENNQPKAVKIEGYDHFGRGIYSMVATERVWNGKEMVERIISKEIEEGRIEDYIVFSFELEKNGKKVFLVEQDIDEDKLIVQYIFVDQDGVVEYEYPNEKDKNTDFTFSEIKKDEDYSISFYNGYARYTIYDYDFYNSRQVGVKVVVGGKTYDLKADVETVKGKLGSFDSSVYNNVASID